MIKTLFPKEANLLMGIARRSKMDCWFSVTLDGECRDLENKGAIIETPKAIRQLVEDMTFEDLCLLTDSEKYQLINLLLKC